MKKSTCHRSLNTQVSVSWPHLTPYPKVKKNQIVKFHDPHLFFQHLTRWLTVICNFSFVLFWPLRYQTYIMQKEKTLLIWIKTRINLGCGGGNGGGGEPSLQSHWLCIILQLSGWECQPKRKKTTFLAIMTSKLYSKTASTFLLYFINYTLFFFKAGYFITVCPLFLFFKFNFMCTSIWPVCTTVNYMCSALWGREDSRSSNEYRKPKENMYFCHEQGLSRTLRPTGLWWIRQTVTNMSHTCSRVVAKLSFLGSSWMTSKCKD